MRWWSQRSGSIRSAARSIRIASATRSRSRCSISSRTGRKPPSCCATGPSPAPCTEIRDRPRFSKLREDKTWSVPDLLVIRKSFFSQLAGGTLAAAVAPGMLLRALAQVAGVRLVDDEIHERLAAELLRHAPGLGLREPHERRLGREARVHAQAERDLKRLDGVVAAIRIAGEVGLAHSPDQAADAAPVGERAGEREEEEIAPGHERVRQARRLHPDLDVVGHRRGAERIQHIHFEHVVLAEARSPARKFFLQLLEDPRPAIQLDAVALAVVEADGPHALVALGRPGKAGGRVLTAGE